MMAIQFWNILKATELHTLKSVMACEFYLNFKKNPLFSYFSLIPASLSPVPLVFAGHSLDYKTFVFLVKYTHSVFSRPAVEV